MLHCFLFYLLTGFGFLTSTTLTITPPFSILPDHILNLMFSKPGTLGSDLELKLEILEYKESITLILPIVSKYKVVSSAPYSRSIVSLFFELNKFS